jgi:hypothetical protein
MQSILDKITEWLKGMLIDSIVTNLSGMFESVNQQVGKIAGEVGLTPAGWNSGVFSMIRNLSETVIIPISGMILAFVMTYELIQMIIDRNNLHDIDLWIFFKWIFKTFVAVLLVTNTFKIVMGIFEMAQSVVNTASGTILTNASVDLASSIPGLETRLTGMDLGPLFGLWFQSMFVGLTMHALTICIFLVIYGRMIEIYLLTSIGPIPMATLANHEWGNIGQNYIRSLLALGFQAFLIMVCVGIYAALVRNIAVETDIIAAVWTTMGYTVLLCFTLFKTGSLAKSIFNAH